MNQNKTVKQKRLGWGAGMLIRWFGRKPKPYSAAQLYKTDFHPNTQKMGLRFTEPLRKVFRLYWLRLK